MPRTPMALLSPADQERRRGLRRMKTVALGALLVMAAAFIVAFWLEGAHPWLGYLRAAAEGGMVGALADWFAVTALFRHPLGVPIPHTAIIPNRKDEIGRSLGEFVETNFLAGDAVRTSLEKAEVARTAGAWLREERNAERLASEGATVASAVLRALSDDDVRDLITDLARQHLIAPEWGPSAGGWLAKIVESDAHRGAVDLAADSVVGWLESNEQTFQGLVSRRLPGWVPKLAHRFVDDTVYREALTFARAVQDDPHHPARAAIDDYLSRLADRLQSDPETRLKLEGAKATLFDSPKVAGLAAEAWETAKNGLLTALADPESGLRVRSRAALIDIGERLTTDASLRARVDGWVVDAAVFLVGRYRHDIASIITDTVARWDAAETTEKIELMVGRDLQYIRLNGTVVGALAGLAIFTVAHLLIPGV